MTDVETKRGRVRRLLIAPLEERGFRFPKGMDPKAGRDTLDAICDDLAYMRDHALGALCESMRTKGEGASKCFWPSRATFIGYAEDYQSRPLEELPAMSSWFRSVAGPKARAAGTMVPTLLFIEEKKRPPRTPEDLAKLRVNGLWWPEIAREVECARDRDRRGMARSGDADLLAWHDKLAARAEALVAAGEAKRGEAA